MFVSKCLLLIMLIIWWIISAYQLITWLYLQLRKTKGLERSSSFSNVSSHSLIVEIIVKLRIVVFYFDLG